MRHRTTRRPAPGATAKFALPADFFDGTVNEPVLHQAVKVYLNNQRQGTAATKTRSFVSGGNQKPWKQKGTGRARQGSTRAPHWRGGGVVFGPSPRDYRTDIPRKVKQLARRSALDAAGAEGACTWSSGSPSAPPRTAQLAELLDTLGLDGQKVLVLTAGANTNVFLSGRNLPTVEVLPYVEASAYDVIWADATVVEEGALTGVMPEPLPDEPESAETAAPRAKKAPKKSVAKAAKKSAAKAATKKKATAKKAAKTRRRRPSPRRRRQVRQEGRAEEEERVQVMPALHQVVVRPVVTEKSSAAYQTRKEYAFEVHPEANKYQIRDALQKLFGVTVTDVRTMQMRRHAVTRGRTRGTTARWKKAIVTLKDGDSIAVFEG